MSENRLSPPLTATQMQLLMGATPSSCAEASTIVFNPFPTQPQVLCTVCQRYVCGGEGSENWKMHVEGKPHLRAVLLAQQTSMQPSSAAVTLTEATPESLAAVAVSNSSPSKPSPASGTTICEICDKQISGVRGDLVWQTHVSGGAHIRAEMLKSGAHTSGSSAAATSSAVKADAPGWYCDVCKKTLLCRHGDPDYLLHVQGEKHLRAEKLLRDPPPAPPDPASDASTTVALPEQPLPLASVFCVVCETAVPGQRDSANWYAHVDGQAHKRKLKRMQELFPSDFLEVIQQREIYVQRQQAAKQQQLQQQAAKSIAIISRKNDQDASVRLVSPLASLVSGSSLQRRSQTQLLDTAVAASETQRPSSSQDAPPPPTATTPAAPVIDNAHLFISVGEMTGSFVGAASLLPEDMQFSSKRKHFYSFAHLPLSSPTEIALGAASGSVWWHSRDGSTISPKAIIASAVEQVSNLRPDVVSLQHVELSMKSDLNSCLKSVCKDMQYELTPTSDVLSGISMQKNRIHGHRPMLCIAYSKNRFTLVAQRLRSLDAIVDSLCGQEFGYSHAVCSRSCGLSKSWAEAQLLCLVLEDNITKQVTVVASCELPHQPHLDDFRSACIREAYSFAYGLADVANTKRVVMLGDFGCPPSSLAYRHLTDLTLPRVERRYLRARDGDEAVTATLLDDENDATMVMARAGCLACAYACVATLPATFMGDMHTITAILVDESCLTDPREFFKTTSGSSAPTRWDKWSVAMYDECQGAFVPLISSNDVTRPSSTVAVDGRSFVVCELPGPCRVDSANRSLRIMWAELHPSDKPLTGECDVVLPPPRFSPSKQVLVQGLSFGIRRELNSDGPARDVCVPAATWDVSIGGLMRSAYATYRQWALRIGVPQIARDAPDPLLSLMSNVFVDAPPSQSNGLAIGQRVLGGIVLSPSLRLQNSIPYATWQEKFGPYSREGASTGLAGEPWFTMAYPCAGGALPDAMNAKNAKEDSHHRFEWGTTDYITFQREAFRLVRIAKLPSLASLGCLALPSATTSQSGSYSCSSHLPLCAVLEVV